jgi:hypothetical protein
MSLITEHRDWVDENMLKNLWGSTVCQPRWFFGQKSNSDTVYPMWGQGFYDTFRGEYKEDANQWIREVGDLFMDICGDEYVMVRNMLAGNTFGQDGDIHDDWLVPGESLTGVLYLNRRWEDNWGGETVVYNREDRNQVEISKFEAGKLIVFDGSNPHIGKGPQRACGELRCIIAVQAVKQDAWQKHLDKMRNKS